MSAVETITQQSTPTPSRRTIENAKRDAYLYAHLLPHFSQDHYDPLTPFIHVDPGVRALVHSNPRAFLEGATKITDLTPKLGTEVHGNIRLTRLGDDGRDQLALEVSSQFKCDNLLRQWFFDPRRSPNADSWCSGTSKTLLMQALTFGRTGAGISAGK